MGARVLRQGARRLSGGVAVAVSLSLICLVAPAQAVSTTLTQIDQNTVNGQLILTFSSSFPHSSSSATSSLDGSVGRAEADAAAGILKGFADSSSAFTLNGGNIRALANVNDEFTLQGLDPSTLVTLTASLTLHGLLLADPIAANQFANNPPFLPQSSVGAVLFYAQEFVAHGDVRLGIFAHDLNACLANGCGGVIQPIDALLVLPMTIRPGSPFTLLYILSSPAFGEATADFGATASLSFNLPAGTSITSVGGYSQSSAPPSVPQPSTLVLLGSSLAGLAALRARVGLRHPRGLVKKGS